MNKLPTNLLAEIQKNGRPFNPVLTVAQKETLHELANRLLTQGWEGVERKQEMAATLFSEPYISGLFVYEVGAGEEPERKAEVLRGFLDLYGFEQGKQLERGMGDRGLVSGIKMAFGKGKALGGLHLYAHTVLPPGTLYAVWTDGVEEAKWQRHLHLIVRFDEGGREVGGYEQAKAGSTGGGDGEAVADGDGRDMAGNRAVDITTGDAGTDRVRDGDRSAGLAPDRLAADGPQTAADDRAGGAGSGASVWPFRADGGGGGGGDSGAGGAGGDEGDQARGRYGRIWSRKWELD